MQQTTARVSEQGETQNATCLWLTCFKDNDEILYKPLENGFCVLYFYQEKFK